eukprot:scaffold38441_cov214-Amphora_coffeaeformis.AAC.1
MGDDDDDDTQRDDQSSSTKKKAAVEERRETLCRHNHQLQYKIQHTLTNRNTSTHTRYQATMGEYGTAQQNAAYTLKSYALNLASYMLFAWPFVAYFSYETPYASILAVVAVIVLLIPPMGWKRPHPYSDQPGNRTAKGGPPTKKAE